MPPLPGSARTPDPDAPYLTIVIPAYNEARRLPTTLATVWAYLGRQPYQAEVIVVDDGSEDNTAALVEALNTAAAPVRLIRNPHLGKGATVRTGMLAGGGRYILYSDADFSTPIDEIEKLLPWLEDHEYDIAIGSREGQGARRIGEPGYRHLMGRVFNTLVRIIALRQFADTQCGFKCFTRAAAHDLFRQVQLYGEGAEQVKGARVTGFDVEVLYLALKRGYKVKEVPVKWIYFSGSKVNPAADSLRLLLDVVKVRLNDMQGKYRQGRGGRTVPRSGSR
jgi:glycosyltransferase involved in cell wall biosynthesis